MPITRIDPNPKPGPECTHNPHLEPRALPHSHNHNHNPRVGCLTEAINPHLRNDQLAAWEKFARATFNGPTMNARFAYAGKVRVLTFDIRITGTWVPSYLPWSLVGHD